MCVKNLKVKEEDFDEFSVSPLHYGSDKYVNVCRVRAAANKLLGYIFQIF